MKKNHLILAITLMTFVGYKSNAQVPGLPNPSATQTIIQEVGLGNVAIAYSRPNTKGRKIFGNLIPYGKLWRTGANSSTSITFSEDVALDGHDVPAGSYTLYTIPEKDEWTIILNKTVKTWGAYTYDQKDDLLRFKVKTINMAEKQESFTIQFANSTTNSAHLFLMWDHTAASMHLEAKDDAKIMANIEGLMKAEQVSNLIYFNAIQYYYFNNKDVDKALSWIARAEKDFPSRASYKLFRSRFLLRKGDKAGARAAAELGIKLSREAKDTEYLRLNQEALELAGK